jgi:hypothetical protein
MVTQQGLFYCFFLQRGEAFQHAFDFFAVLLFVLGGANFKPVGLFFELNFQFVATFDLSDIRNRLTKSVSAIARRNVSNQVSIKSQSPAATSDRVIVNYWRSGEFQFFNLPLQVLAVERKPAFALREVKQ